MSEVNRQNSHDRSIIVFVLVVTSATLLAARLILAEMRFGAGVPHRSVGEILDQRVHEPNLSKQNSSVRDEVSISDGLMLPAGVTTDASVSNDLIRLTQQAIPYEGALASYSIVQEEAFGSFCRTSIVIQCQLSAEDLVHFLVEIRKAQPHIWVDRLSVSDGASGRAYETQTLSVLARAYVIRTCRSQDKTR